LRTVHRGTGAAFSGDHEKARVDGAGHGRMLVGKPLKGQIERRVHDTAR